MAEHMEAQDSAASDNGSMGKDKMVPNELGAAYTLAALGFLGSDSGHPYPRVGGDTAAAQTMGTSGTISRLILRALNPGNMVGDSEAKTKRFLDYMHGDLDKDMIANVFIVKPDCEKKEGQTYKNLPITSIPMMEIQRRWIVDKCKIISEKNRDQRPTVSAKLLKKFSYLDCLMIWVCRKLCKVMARSAENLGAIENSAFPIRRSKAGNKGGKKKGFSLPQSNPHMYKGYSFDMTATKLLPLKNIGIARLVQQVRNYDARIKKTNTEPKSVGIRRKEIIRRLGFTQYRLLANNGHWKPMREVYKILNTFETLTPGGQEQEYAPLPCQWYGTTAAAIQKALTEGKPIPTESVINIKGRGGLKNMGNVAAIVCAGKQFAAREVQALVLGQGFSIEQMGDRNKIPITALDPTNVMPPAFTLFKKSAAGASSGGVWKGQQSGPIGRQSCATRAGYSNALGDIDRMAGGGVVNPAARLQNAIRNATAKIASPLQSVVVDVHEWSGKGGEYSGENGLLQINKPNPTSSTVKITVREFSFPYQNLNAEGKVKKVSETMEEDVDAMINDLERGLNRGPSGPSGRGARYKPYGGRPGRY